MTARHDPITTETWKSILAAAIPILDDLSARSGSMPDIVLGGGTVLMLRFHHRLSRDIDFFLNEVQLLSMITPRLNDLTSRISLDYVEQANSVKLVLNEGDIDFIVAGNVTRSVPVETILMSNRVMRLETTEEIIAKKLFYRAAHFKPRDVFDLVAVHRRESEAVERALRATVTRKAQLERRLAELAKLSGDELATDILPFEGFSSIIPTMVRTAQNLVAPM
jgi:predicted nucleotidyltransferase component of viral defense system